MKSILPILPFLISDLLCGGSAALAQGPLAPPNAPAPTQKTLQQIEPRADLMAAIAPPGVNSDDTHQYVISQPGSYYLSGNLTLTKPVGILIEATGVTLDLNGFSLNSPAGSNVTTTGIEIGDGFNIRILNGSINGNSHGSLGSGPSQTFNDVVTDGTVDSLCGGELKNIHVAGCNLGFKIGGLWLLQGCHVDQCYHNEFIIYNAGQAVDCEASGSQTGSGFITSTGEVFSHCSASGNAGDGFSGQSGVYSDCIASGNYTGFDVSGSATLSNCSSHDNTGEGIICGGYTVLSNCEFSSNGTAGLSGNGDANLVNCQAIKNAQSGFRCSGVATMTNCTAHLNKGAGFDLGYKANLTGCSANQNSAAGFSCDLLGTFTNCSAVLNTLNGFTTDQDAHLNGCTASQNGLPHDSIAAAFAVGISVADHSTVRNCSVEGNNGDGILATAGCMITGNHVSANCHGNYAGTAGIHLTLSTNDVEDNAISDNTVDGINAEANRNFIARNRARNNTLNYVIAPGNRVAQIVITAPTTAAINGANTSNSEGFTSIDPWANFSY